jgi:hypothetical protein
MSVGPRRSARLRNGDPISMTRIWIGERIASGDRKVPFWTQELIYFSCSSKIELRDLEIEKVKLDLAIKEFQKSNNTGDWTFDGVTAAVNDAKAQWTNKKRFWSGKPQDHFHDMMGKFDAHSNLFTIFPSENNYGSIVAGAIKSLVKVSLFPAGWIWNMPPLRNVHCQEFKTELLTRIWVTNLPRQASVNHKKTVEVLSKALKEINDEADLCAIEIKLIRSERVKKALARFYTDVFLFYADAINWYKETSIRKVRYSLNEKFSEEFAEKLAEIKRKAQRVRHEASFGSDAEQRYMRLNQENANDDMRIGFVGVARKLQEHEHTVEQLRLEQQRTTAALEALRDPTHIASLQAQQWKTIGVTGSTLMLENARSIMAETVHVPEMRLIQEMEEIPEVQEKEAPIEEVISTKAEEKEEPNELKRSDIQLRSSQLLDYIRRGATIINVDPAIPLYLDVGMAVALEQWTLAKTSKMLYLEEQAAPQIVSGPSLAAVRMVWSSVDLKIPVISFFCDADPDDDSDGEKKSSKVSEDPLLGMVYSLVHQLIGLLPPLLDPESRLTTARFDSLDGSNKSWNTALELLKDMLDMAPPLLSCIIDGIHTFHETSTGQIHQLVEVFRHAMKTEGKIFKALFTTYGRATKLVFELRGNEMVIMEGSQHFGGLPGGPMPGTRIFDGK